MRIGPRSFASIGNGFIVLHFNLIEVKTNINKEISSDEGEKKYQNSFSVISNCE